MALTTVSGVVASVVTGAYGAGVRVTETITAGDRSFDRNWMAWFKELPAVAQGDNVTITGSLMVKLSRDKDSGLLKTYTDRATNELVPYQDYSINDCALDPTW